MTNRWLWTCLAGATGLLLVQRAAWPFLAVSCETTGPRRPAQVRVEFVETGWAAETIRELPERVTALTTFREERHSADEVFVGTSPVGGVYRFWLDLSPATITPIATNLGDGNGFGTCEVSCLAVSDLDGDGSPELLAETSQVNPAGRPRVYVWSMPAGNPILLGMARPEIASRWSHGFAIIDRDRPSRRVFTTFCGLGEVVELRLSRDAPGDDRFSREGLDWRVLDRLPASGEQATAADADNDGRDDLCLATGFSRNRAAIMIYDVADHDGEPVMRHVIDESDHFGNVRFAVSDLDHDGTRELIAWWCTDLSFGDTMMVRYVLDAGGVRERSVLIPSGADAPWPRDGQFAVADMDDDGIDEVWFVTGAGRLWRYDPSSRPCVREVATIDGEVGPLAAGRVGAANRPSLFVGSGRSVVQLTRSDRASAELNGRAATAVPLATFPRLLPTPRSPR